MKTGHAVWRLLACASLAAILASFPIPVRAQDPRELMPAESAAKAKEIIDQAIDALGGQIYLSARDYDCKGTSAQFESSGALGGYVETRVLRQFPDKIRTELDSKTFITDIYGIPVNTKGRRIVTVYTADKGWAVGTDGVSELPPDALTDYQDQLKVDVNNILRYRLSQGGLILRYDGSDIVDVKQVDWVEITDPERHTIRVAFEKKTYFPVRVSVTTRDPLTGGLRQTDRVYSNYRMFDGLMAPLQTSVFVNDHQVSQLFFNTCQYNTGLSSDLFSGPGLEAEFAKLSKKK
jgi:hypothetical protein